MRIALRCPAEGRTIGFLAGAPGARIDAAAFQHGFEAAPGYAFAPRAVQDGAALLCPRCRNPVVLAGGEKIPIVPGTLRFGPGEVPHVEAPAG